MLEEVYSFNRTILELKRPSVRHMCSTSNTFNRTILELKLCQTAMASLCFMSFNRTILELKHWNNNKFTDNNCLLIVPFWN